MLLQPVYVGCPCKSLISAGIFDTKDARLKGGDVCPVSLMPGEQGTSMNSCFYALSINVKQFPSLIASNFFFAKVNCVWGVTGLVV